jgi:hypothetical protein
LITLEDNQLIFRFPEVHEAARCEIRFQRTLRIPDDGGEYPLPPGLGRFPLRHLDDYARRIPENWLARGGVVMPMHQAEALWLGFVDGAWGDYPCAARIATGKICAITGAPWSEALSDSPQNYVVLSEQPWLDGYCVEKGVIRQFVAMPLGAGYSVEEQITGAAEHGGLQIAVYPMKAERYEKMRREQPAAMMETVFSLSAGSADMGLAPGGRMKQEIYDDPFGLDAWDQSHSSRCFVTIANSLTWVSLTGERPPTKPPTAERYTKAGLPWFDYYGGDAAALDGAEALKQVLSVAELGEKTGEAPLPENESLDVELIVALRKPGSDRVREMTE